MGTSSKAAALALALLFASPAFARGGRRKADAPAAPAPSAQELLSTVLAGSKVAYQGRMMVTQWVEQRARAHEIEVSFSPPARFRWDFLGHDGEVERRAVSDGDQEYVCLLKQGRILAGDAVKSSTKLMTPERERELLLKNYELSSSGPEKSVGRPAWVLELKPKVEGKLTQKLWVDEETGVVLEARRYRVKGRFAAMSRFNRFEPKGALPESLFDLGTDTRAVVEAPGLAPDFLSLEDLRQATGRSVDLPLSLPGGFDFESADYFDVKGSVVRHLRYTDGLAVLSLFETDKPVKAPKEGAAAAEFIPVNVLGALRLSSSGWLTQFKRGGQYYTLMGDVSRDLLKAISVSLKEHANKTAAR